LDEENAIRESLEGLSEIMDKPKTAKTIVKVLAVLAITMLLALTFVALYLNSVNQKDLYPSEIRNYQGEDLSSINNVEEEKINGTQYINATSYMLTVTGLVDRTLSLSYNDILNNYQTYKKVVTIHCVEGWTAKILWEGFLVSDLLKQAGVNPNATTAIFYASDGYSTSLPIDYLSKNNIIIAYKMNNITMPPERGFPFELVAESQYGYKWIKWLTTIEISDNSSYLGFWESRGYPNNATTVP
jgi:DMSO/TMAO reductase YedYZ molybdopterin-dependent catalytic subunit